MGYSGLGTTGKEKEFVCTLKGFHSWDLIAVASFSGCLAVFWKFFFLAFRRTLWPASSEGGELRELGYTTEHRENSWFPQLLALGGCRPQGLAGRREGELPEHGQTA